MAIIDGSPVANGRPFFRAIGPDRSLDVAGKNPREGAVELARIDGFAQSRQNRRATSRPVALGPVRVTALARLRMPVRTKKL